MDKYYHFTSSNNLYSIREKGLMPHNGFRCQSILDESTGVFLSKGIDKSIIMYANMFSYYSKLIGPEGDKALSDCEIELKELTQKGHSFYNTLKIKGIITVSFK